MTYGANRMKQGFRCTEKIRLVGTSMGLTGVKLGEYVRENGIYLSELNEWKSKMLIALNGERPLVNEERNRFKEEIDSLKEEVEKLKLLLEFKKKVDLAVQRKKVKSTKKK